MRNLICLMLFVVTSTMYSQTSIVNDSLYLQYEAAYTKHSLNYSPLIYNLDRISHEFYTKLGNGKSLTAFNKSKNKEKWLQKNVKKTSFLDAQEAVFLYTSMKEIEQYQEEQGKEMKELLRKLKQKYDGALIWDALKSRLSDNKKEEL